MSDNGGSITDFLFGRKALKRAADSGGPESGRSSGPGQDTSSGREAGSSVRDAISATRPEPAPARNKKRAPGKKR